MYFPEAYRHFEVLCITFMEIPPVCLFEEAQKSRKDLFYPIIACLVEIDREILLLPCQKLVGIEPAAARVPERIPNHENLKHRAFQKHSFLGIFIPKKVFTLSASKSENSEVGKFLDESWDFHCLLNWATGSLRKVPNLAKLLSAWTFIGEEICDLDCEWSLLVCVPKSAFLFFINYVCPWAEVLMCFILENLRKK